MVNMVSMNCVSYLYAFNIQTHLNLYIFTYIVSPKYLSVGGAKSRRLLNLQFYEKCDQKGELIAQFVKFHDL